MSKYQIIGLIVAVVLLVSVPLGVYLVQKQTQVKSKAAADYTSLILVSDKNTVNPGDNFTVTLQMSPNVALPTGIDVKFKFDTQYFQVTSITPSTSSPFDVVAIPSSGHTGFDNTTGEVRYAAVHSTSDATFATTQTLVAITFKAKLPSGMSYGVGFIDFDDSNSANKSGSHAPTTIQVIGNGSRTTAGFGIPFNLPALTAGHYLNIQAGTPPAHTVTYSVTDPSTQPDQTPPPVIAGSPFHFQMTNRSDSAQYVALKIQKQGSGISARYDWIHEIAGGYDWGSTNLQQGHYTLTLMSGCSYSPTLDCAGGSPYNSFSVDIIPPAASCPTAPACPAGTQLVHIDPVPGGCAGYVCSANPTAPPTAPTHLSCAVSGDLDGNGLIQENDFTVWKNAFINGNPINTCSGEAVDLVLFNTWRSKFAAL